jgi:hypothetical protein
MTLFSSAWKNEKGRESYASSVAVVPGYPYHNLCDKPNLFIRPNLVDLHSLFNSSVLTYTYSLKRSAG